MSISAMNIPDRLKSFPVTEDGLPIHFTVNRRKDGTHDFTAIHPGNRLKAIACRLCHICGQDLDRIMAFITGDETQRKFTDGPMHDECAKYALVVCPYLRDKNYKPTSNHADSRVIARYLPRPDKLYLYYCDGYEFDGMYIHAREPVRVTLVDTPATLHRGIE